MKKFKSISKLATAKLKKTQLNQTIGGSIFDSGGSYSQCCTDGLSEGDGGENQI